MNEAQEVGVARFHFSKWDLVLTWTGALFGLALIALMTFGLSVSIPTDGSAYEWFMFLGGICLVICVVCLLRLHWKYRHVCQIDYVVTRHGIWIEDRKGKTFVSWEDVGRAEYMPLVGVFRLRVQDQQDPIVLFTRGPDEYDDPPTGHRGLGKKFVREGLKSKLNTLWVPW